MKPDGESKEKTSKPKMSKKENPQKSLTSGDNLVYSWL